MSEMDNATIKRKSLQGVLSYGARSGIQYAVAVVATGILSALLSPEEFGVYFIVTAVIGMFTFISDVGLAATLIQQKEEPSTKALRTTFTVQQILAFVIFGLTIALTPVWKQYTNLSSEGLELLYVLAFSFILASLKTIPSILLERKLEFGKLTLPQLIEQLIFYVTAVALAYQGLGIRSFVVAVLVRSIMGVLIIYRLQSWPLGFHLSLATLKNMLPFGVKFQLNDLLARLKDDLYIVVLARFIAPAEIGYLGWAKRWSMFPYQMSVQNLIAILFPTFSRLQTDKEKMGKALEISLMVTSLIIFPILVGMAVMAYPITIVFPDYLKWQPALIPLAFFCLNVVFASVSNPVINSLNAMGYVHLTLKLMTVMTALTWVLTPVVLRFFGFNGIALLSAIVASASLFSYRWIRPMVQVRVLASIYPALVSAGIMGLILWQTQFLWSLSVPHLVTGIACGVFLYAASVAILAGKKIYWLSKELMGIRATG
jgi:O-antigen/teichoic acid export membrane protein